MDYQKIDSALAIALSEDRAPEERSLEVLVDLERQPNRDESALLQRLGIRQPERGTVLTGRLSAQDLAELSRQGWVRKISLSQRLRPLGKDSD